jgi:Holliday junction resolvase-like predicted endonuclease
VTVATAGAAGPVIGAFIASAGLTGTAATVATGVAVGAVAGAVGGVAGEVTRTGLSEGRLPTGREIGRAALIGGALGGLTGGAAAFASTARGAAALSTASKAIGRIPGAQTAGELAGAVGRGAQTVARLPGVSQAVRATGAVARATGRGLGAIERTAGSAGLRVARGAFSNEGATNFLNGFQATRSVAAGFGVARTATTEVAAADAAGGAAGGGTGGAAAPAPAPPPPAPPSAGAPAPAPVAPPTPAPTPPASTAGLTTGQIGEQEAANFLQANGYTNVRSIQNASNHGIDLVGDHIATGEAHFFEVKASVTPRAPSLSPAQRSIATFVPSRLGRAAGGAGQWQNVAGTSVQADAIALQGRMPIRGQVITVTNVGSPAGPTIRARTW